MPRALHLESFTFPKKWSSDLRLTHARVLVALMPKGDSKTATVLTREELAQRVGWTRTSGTINKALHGIHAGSSSGSPHQGVLELGLVEEVERDGIKAYQITPDGCKAVEKLVDELPKPKDKASCTNDRYLGTTPTQEEIIEGRRRLKLHKVKERKPRIVKRKKKSVLKATGLLLCEACGFDFAAVYGKLGERFAECHHRLPLAEYDAEAPTRLEDLAIVCANCHRMLHRSRPMMKVEELRSLILQRRAERLQIRRAEEDAPMEVPQDRGGADDPHDLKRFVDAQEGNFKQALSEVRSGRKRSHWMWYIFPQYDGLGSSSMCRRYSIKSVAEAEAYLSHPVLGPRLRECAEAVLRVEGRFALDIFGSPDDLKLRSCATLFACVSPVGSVFDRLLGQYFQGERDSKTLHLLGIAPEVK